MSIQKNIIKREIKVLVHFTRLSNLESILDHGLIPRAHLGDIECHVNDGYRLDGFPEANCLSVTFPNYKMFYALRMEDRSIPWTVIGLRPSILSDYECAFCNENAASKNVTCVDINHRKGCDAFEGMFGDIEGRTPRVGLDLKPNRTTSPQAEVLVFNTIKPSDIIGAWVPNTIIRDEYRAKYNDKYQFEVGEAVFSRRKDWTHWQKK